MSAHPPAGSAGPRRWETVDSAIHATCRVFSVRRKTARHPTRGTEADFFVVESPDWVNVIALTPAGELVMVTQFRFGIDALSLEIPGGLIEAGEDPLAAARRELLEETGYGGGEARLLGTIHPNPAILDNRCHLVFIDQVVPQAGCAWDEHEELQLSLLPVDQVYAAARRGGITHSLVLDALFLFEPEWRRRRAPV